MTQSDLANLIPASRPSIGKWENGDIDLSTANLLRLCQIFGCTADYLLGWSSWRSPAISEEEAELLRAYHAAPEQIKTIIDTALAPYKEQEGQETAAG